MLEQCLCIPPKPYIPHKTCIYVAKYITVRPIDELPAIYIP